MILFSQVMNILIYDILRIFETHHLENNFPNLFQIITLKT